MHATITIKSDHNNNLIKKKNNHNNKKIRKKKKKSTRIRENLRVQPPIGMTYTHVE